jgi:hypothetical protein
MKLKKHPARGWISPRQVIFLGLFFISPLLSGAPLFSPTWGFRLDLPEGYQYLDGDGKDRFSFRSPQGAALDLVVYAGKAPSAEAVLRDTERRLKNTGEITLFDYRNKKAALMDLSFSTSQGPHEGWGLCIELEGKAGETKPLLLALAYGPAEARGLQSFHFSALDSIAPTEADRRTPGPITEFTYPRGEQKRVSLAGPEESGLRVLICEHDAEAAQALVDREFSVLRAYQDSPLWKEAWTRFYRAIYRDSFDRLADAAFILERHWNRSMKQEEAPEGGPPGYPRELAERALQWVQGFTYERDLMGSDFVNLISAATEGRGDCDSRALLWAILLEQANIPAAIMVSREYGHAMGLADIAGTGARFDWEDKKWLVAETTATVPLGLIGASSSDPTFWLGITF